MHPKTLSGQAAVVSCGSFVDPSGTSGQPNVKVPREHLGGSRGSACRCADWCCREWMRMVRGEMRCSDGVFLRTFRENAGALVRLLGLGGER